MRERAPRPEADGATEGGAGAEAELTESVSSQGELVEGRNEEAIEQVTNELNCTGID